MDKRSSPETDVLIVGAGIAGLAAARLALAAGKRVVVLEKSRGVGGRLATRRLSDQSFDHGAHFFSVSGDAFKAELDRWEGRGLADLWFRDGERRLFRGRPSMNALAKELCEGVNVQRQQRVTSVTFGDDGATLDCEGGERWRGKQVLFTCPAPQALAIVEGSAIDLESEVRERLAGVRYDPCVTLLLRLQADCGLREPGFVKGVNEILDTVTDVRRKGTSSKPGLVAQSTAAFATRHYQKDRDWLEAALVEAVKEVFAVEIEESYLHKWKFAHRRSEDRGPAFARSQALPLWFAGDSFGAANVEGAYQSGRAAAASLLGS